MKKILVLAVFLLPGICLGQKRFTVEDFVSLPLVAHGVLSPGGKKLAFQRMRRDLKKDAILNQVFLADLEKDKVIQITRAPGNSWAPMWTPDGKGLVFYSTRSGKPELWVTYLDGAEARKLCPYPVSSAKFSPDGKKLAFLAPPKKNPKVKGFGKDPEIRTWIEDKTKWPQLWVLDLESKKRTQLTNGESYIYQFDWRPDSKALAFTFDTKGSEGLSEDHHLGIIDLNGRVKVIGKGNFKYSYPKWSPDGSLLAVFRDRTEEFDVYLNVKDIFVLDPGSGRIIRNLTKSWHGNPTGMLSSPREEMHFSPDGKWIYFSGAEKATLNLYRVKVDGSGGVEPVTGVGGEIRSFSFDREFNKVSFLWSDFAHPGDIFVMDLDSGEFKPKKITSIREMVKPYGFRSPKRITWKSFDGLEIEGFLFLPRDFEKKKPLPVIFHAHGGPAFRWGNSYSYRYMYHVWTSCGFGMLIFNPRGSTGYGQEFQRGNYKGLGQGDFKDLMAGVDYLIEKGITSPERIGMTGYSYGGYLTNLAISHTTRFKAAVSIAGAFNFPSAMAQTNSILPRAYYRPLESEENMLLMFRHSPVARAMKIKTPTLLIHGKKDTAVHYMQAVEMFTCLKLVGTPSKLILYPGEGHGINRPSHMKHYLEQSLAWFRKYLLKQ